MSFPPRIVRVRLGRCFQTIYSEDDPTGHRFPENTRSISFGSFLGGPTSLIHLSPAEGSRELIYFDKYIPFLSLYWMHFSCPSAIPSTIDAVAVRLKDFPIKSSSLLSQSVPMCNPGVASLILVCSSENLLTVAANVPEDQWGFRRIHAMTVAALEPEQYEVGMSLTTEFSKRAGYDINYFFVVDC